MKTKFATVVLCMFFMLHGNAQSDGFFKYQISERAINETPVPYFTREELGFQNMNVNAAPIGNGLLVLSAVSLIYVLSLRRKEDVR